MVDLIGEYGSGEYGSGPYGSAYPPFGLESAIPLTPTLIRVRYTALFDSAFSPLTLVSNYSISPALTIYSVVIESAQTVLLVTSPQLEVVYTLSITDALGYFGQPLDPALDEVTFLGLPVAPSFRAVATRKTRVRAVFSQAMLQNFAFTNPGDYSVRGLDGTPISILAVTAEQVTNPVSVVLELGSDLVDEQQYQVTVSSGILTATLRNITPDTVVFQWVENVLTTSIPVDRFSGEVQNGLYGIHGGLVFFSPALVTAAANSIIQVDSVDVCTKAFDEYHFPLALDPPVLYTYSAATPVANITTLNSPASLWARFPRLMEAQIIVNFKPTDAMPAAVDGLATATLLQPWDPTFVSLLNNTYWKTFDNGPTPPEYFITANNLAPIPPGPPVTIVLHP